MPVLWLRVWQNATEANIEAADHIDVAAVGSSEIGEVIAQFSVGCGTAADYVVCSDVRILRIADNVGPLRSVICQRLIVVGEERR